MNIFNKESVFLGEHPFEALSEATKEIFRLAKDIKKSLGNQGYLLDSYLSMVFESLNSSLAHGVASQGFNVFSDLYGICTLLQGERFGSKDLTEHPYYEIAKKYVQYSPFKNQEKETTRNMYCAALSEGFIDFAVRKFIEKEKDDLRSVFESIQLQEYYSKMAYLVGEEKIGKLSELLKNRFIIARPVRIFLQALTNQFLYCLTYRDKQTSKQIFQLMLDMPNCNICGVNNNV